MKRKFVFILLLSFYNLSAQSYNDTFKDKEYIDLSINDFQPVGLYYYPKDTSQAKVKIDFTLVSYNQSDRSSYRGRGAGKKLYEKSISNKKSRIQICDEQPIFYFYFENNPNPTQDNWLFSVIKNLNEFIIIKLDEKKNGRYFEIGKNTGNWGVNSSGISEENKLGFDTIVIEKNIIKIIFKQPLQVGEYCFIYTGAVPLKFINNKVFDFGICKSK